MKRAHPIESLLHGVGAVTVILIIASIAMNWVSHVI